MESKIAAMFGSPTCLVVPAFPVREVAVIAEYDVYAGLIPVLTPHVTWNQHARLSGSHLWIFF